MFGLKKFLFKGAAPANLPEDVQAALAAWRERAAPVLDDVHFHTRYVVIDIVSTGMNPESDQLLSLAASTVQQGSMQPDDAIFIDFSAPQGEDAARLESSPGLSVDRQLMALLLFIGQSPLVTYHVPYVGAFLQRAFKERLGVDFQPSWIDLAWLLPTMYGDKSQVVMPLDHWIEELGLNGGVGRRNAMENTLLLTRIFQMLLVRAVGKQIDTAAQLVDESSASTFLRRTH